MNAPEVQQFIEKNYRHNFTFNLLDGATFWLGYSLIAPSLILPLYASHFTNNNLLLGIIPSIGSAGYLFPQLFTSNWVQRLPRKKVMPVNLGFFTERLPIFLLPLSVFLFAEHNPALALIVFFFLYTWHSFGAGIVAVGWQDMLAKIFPTDRRGRFLGLTNFLGNGTGVLGSAGAAWLLASFAFPQGYAVTFSAAAVFIFISWLSIAQTREPEVLTTTEKHSQINFFKKLPGVIRRDANFRKYLFTQIVVTLGGMANGFLIIYAVRQWNLPDSAGGYFTSAMLIGQALANLAFGTLADRKGHKLVLEISIFCSICVVGLAVFAPTPEYFYAVFALRGASAAGAILSGIAISLEFSSPEMRPTYIGLSNTISGSAAIIAPLIGGWLANVLGFQNLFIISFCIVLTGFSLMHWFVLEPRKHVDGTIPILES